MKFTVFTVCILIVVGTVISVWADDENMTTPVMTTLEPTTAAMDTTMMMMTSLPGSTSMDTSVMTTASVTSTKAPNTTPTTGMTSRPVTIPTDSPIGPSTGTWIVKDEQGGVCMKMKFASRIYIAYQNISNIYDLAVIDVPTAADARASVCPVDENTPRHFILHLFGQSSYWYLNLTFDSTSKFSLTEVGIAITYDKDNFPNAKQPNGRSYEFITNDNFLNQSVPVGKSFTCSKGLTLQTVTTYITILDLQLQPFADEAEGDFGKTMECSDVSSSNTGLIVGITIGVFFAILLAFGATVFIVRKSQRSGAEDLRPVL